MTGYETERRKMTDDDITGNYFESNQKSGRKHYNKYGTQDPIDEEDMMASSMTSPEYNKEAKMALIHEIQ
jgi:hypothetical protein